MSTYKTPLMESQDIDSLDVKMAQLGQNTRSGARHSAQKALVYNPLREGNQSLIFPSPIDINEFNEYTRGLIEKGTNYFDQIYSDLEDKLQGYKKGLIFGIWTPSMQALYNNEHSVKITDYNIPAPSDPLARPFTDLVEAITISLNNPTLDIYVKFWNGNRRFVKYEKEDPRRFMTLSKHNDEFVMIEITIPGRMRRGAGGTGVDIGTIFSVDLGRFIGDKRITYFNVSNVNHAIAETIDGHWYRSDVYEEEYWTTHGDYDSRFGVNNPKMLTMYLEDNILHIYNNNEIDRRVRIQMYLEPQDELQRPNTEIQEKRSS